MTHSHTHTHAHRAHVQMHFASYAQSWTESLHGSDPIKWTLQASPHRCRSDMCSARARHLPMAPALACAHASRLYASTSRAVVQARVGPLLRLPRLASGLPTIGRTRATIIVAPSSPSCCVAATASLPRVEQPEPSEYTAHDRHRRSLLCNAVRGSAPGESLAGPQQH
jgi:hypothetical protein